MISALGGNGVNLTVILHYSDDTSHQMSGFIGYWIIISSFILSLQWVAPITYSTLFRY